MSEFKREERYLVFKLKDLSPGSIEVLRGWAVTRNMPKRQYVVVESDWPEYEKVWQMIEARVAGVTQPSPEQELANALRQYQHNDCSGIVFGYDKEETERIVAALRAENDAYLEVAHGRNVAMQQAQADARNYKAERDALAAQLDNLAGANEALHKQNVALAAAPQPVAKEGDCRPLYAQPVAPAQQAGQVPDNVRRAMQQLVFYSEGSKSAQIAVDSRTVRDWLAAAPQPVAQEGE